MPGHNEPGPVIWGTEIMIFEVAVRTVSLKQFEPARQLGLPELIADRMLSSGRMNQECWWYFIGQADWKATSMGHRWVLMQMQSSTIKVDLILQIPQILQEAIAAASFWYSSGICASISVVHTARR